MVVEAGVREVLRPPRADALERRQRPLEHGRVGHWTMSASRGLTRISRISAGNWNGSSRPRPSGSCGRARVVAEHLLQHASRHGHARHRGGAKTNRPTPSRVSSMPSAVTGSRPVSYRIGSSMDEDRFARLTASRSTTACPETRPSPRMEMVGSVIP